MIAALKRFVRKGFYTYRRGADGKFISKAEYDALPERDRMKHKRPRKPDAAALAEPLNREDGIYTRTGGPK